jgi:hypothetical protein
LGRTCLCGVWMTFHYLDLFGWYFTGQKKSTHDGSSTFHPSVEAMNRWSTTVSPSPGASDKTRPKTKT